MTDKALESFKENFTGWDNYYKETKVEDMPWYEKNLDQDLENEITSKNLRKGKFLDLGTGPGTQAIQLAKRNFEVTATDISPSAIEKAKKLSNEINFLVDDVMNSKLSDREFDFIFDMGIFLIPRHILDFSFLIVIVPTCEIFFKTFQCFVSHVYSHQIWTLIKCSTFVSINSLPKVLIKKKKVG